MRQLLIKEIMPISKPWMVKEKYCVNYVISKLKLSIK